MSRCAADSTRRPRAAGRFATLLGTALFFLARLAEELLELLLALRILLVLVVRLRALQRVIDDADQVVDGVGNAGGRAMRLVRAGRGLRSLHARLVRHAVAPFSMVLPMRETRLHRAP
jgi:hypothetical protein